MDTQTSQGNTFVQNIIGQPMEFVGTEADKLWEGEIGGKWIEYFRSKENSNFKDVVIVTLDELPKTFGRIEYCDCDGDNSLDIVNIRMYYEDK